MSSMEHNSSEKKRRALRIAISILVAVTLWLYVDYQKHPNVTRTFRDVPVEFSGEDTTLADKGYMLLSCENTTIDIRLKGSRSVISDLDRSSLRVVADTSSITETGTKTLSYQVYYPDSVSRNNVSVEWASAYTITVQVGELARKEVPIRCELEGEVAKGYTAGDAVLDPAVLELRGQRDDLASVSYAKIHLSVQNAEKTVIQALKFELYDYNDILVQNENIRAAVKLIQVTVPVRTVKEVPLRVEFREAPGSTLSQIEYTISPRTVELTGEKSVLDGIDSILLDTVYLQDITSSKSLHYTIPVPDGCTLPEGVEIATVTIVARDMAETTRTVSQIELENVPDGFDAALVTKSLDVTLHGTQAEIDAITGDDIRLTVDLSSVTEAGNYTLPASVFIGNYENVGAKGKYQVIVNVTKQN